MSNTDRDSSFQANIIQLASTVLLETIPQFIKENESIHYQKNLPRLNNETSNLLISVQTILEILVKELFGHHSVSIALIPQRITRSSNEVDGAGDLYEWTEMHLLVTFQKSVGEPIHERKRSSSQDEWPVGFAG